MGCNCGNKDNTRSERASRERRRIARQAAANAAKAGVQKPPPNRETRQK